MKSNFLLIGAIAFGIIGITDAAPRAGVGSMGGAGGGMMGGMPNTAKLGGAMAKIFGEKTTFTADMESKTTGDKAMTIPGRMSFDGGKSRTEIDMAQAKGNALPPEMAAQMKAMGMEKMIAISLPEKKINYIIYPAMEAYVEMDFSEPNSKTKSEEYKVKTQELGKETLDGRPTIKSKVIISDSSTQVMEAIVWNAPDLKSFPVKVEQEMEGTTITTSFKNVKFDKPAASQFEPPANFKKHTTMMELMQEMVMKQMQGAGGMNGMGMPPQKAQKR